MNKIIKIPKGTRYISQFPDIEKDILVSKPTIINKKLTGCGFSSYFLSSTNWLFPTILISPRVFMIQSKVNDPQFKHLIQWRTETQKKKSVEELKEILKANIQAKLVLNEIPKIITTYDSFRNVKDVIKELGLLDNFYFVVDEQQDIIKDSAFKGNIIRTFLKELEGLNKVIYLSATPTPKEFNDKIQILKDIDYITIEWNKSDLRKINFTYQTISKKDSFLNILKKYKSKFDKDGYFKKKTIDGKVYYSRELNIFCSNVELITHLIKKLGLNNSNTDVICSENPKQIKKLYENTRIEGVKKSGFKPSKPKQKGETRKTYQFITRCSYEGSDFYSPSATTIIFSNPSIDCMSIDIGIDLYQIIGRERLETNVFRDDITLYSQYIGIFKSFQEMRKIKLSSSEEYLDFLNNSKNKEFHLNRVKRLDFQSYYIEINEISGDPQLSELRMLAEDYSESFRLEQFKGEKYVFKCFNESDYNNRQKDQDLEDLNKFYSNFQITFNFQDKMKLLCYFLDSKPHLKPLIRNNSNFEQTYLDYYEELGTSIIKANLFREDLIIQKIKIKNATINITNLILDRFKVGDELEVKQIKQILQDIYKQLGLKKKAKSTELKEYFTISKPKSKRVGKEVKTIVKIEKIK